MLPRRLGSHPPATRSHPPAIRSHPLATRPQLLAAAVLALGVALAGCGKTLPAEGQGRGAAVTTVASTGQLAASGLATKNTTRLGGADPVADAAAVALATYPGLTPASRPQAVVLVDARDWPAALAATALASAPLRAPLLYSEGDSLPAISAQALAALKPTGAALLGGAQVIEVGTTAAPAGYRIRTLGGAQTSDGPVGSGHSGGGPTGGPTSDGQAGGGSGAEAARAPAAVAAQVERLVEILHGGAPHRVLAIGAAGPRALAMPAAGLAAESGAPVLPVGAAGIPPATRAVLLRLRRPTIYAVGPPAAVSHTVLSKLARLGSVRRIYAGPVAGGGDPAENAIAVARFGEGAFGWTIEQPGHGLVFANASRPLDAPAAAPLSASGEYGPLLLLERP
ncbi:MAG TPA: cell wall-binding repeat-containing protein, partial [Solirubrobacteraceae bacterium]|nr:cell wall-binding repeat-containing protein [Solirubrobacteraceae bacterium]